MSPDARHRIAYVATDYCATAIAWLAFNVVRYYTLDEVNYATNLLHFLTSNVVIWGQLLFPLLMMGLYWLSGFYNKTFSKSRLEVMASSIGSVALGVVLIYFIAIIDDPIPDRLSNYTLIMILGALLLGMILIVRLTITTIIQSKLGRGVLSDNVILIGDKKSIVDSIRRLSAYRKSMGMEVVGAVITDEGRAPEGIRSISMETLAESCKSLNVNKIILTVRPNESDTILNMVRNLYYLNLPVMVPAWSAGSVLARIKVRNITGEPLTDLTSVQISENQRNVKRLFDIVISGLALVALSPLMLVVAIMIKRDSKGTIFYSQERVGLHRKKFKIYKFRTMNMNAEAEGPALATDDDPRITKIGHTLRKYRIDELPQFWNVIKGDMSLVGPRPEREYYEEQLIALAPHYTLVHQVRPGLTSWGMVKYGYAQTVEQMSERLSYDMIYLENVSLLVDIKIMFHTVRTVITGKGI